MPELYIISGSNGAGKSSVGSNYLPDYIRVSCEVFDGDKLFVQKQKELWKQGITAIKEAKNIALAFVTNTFDRLAEEALTTQANFVYEGHFTNEATWEIPKSFKASGYSLHFIFLGLKDPGLSQVRVLNRIKKGGHYVQPSEIANNFFGNPEKLNKYYILFDTLIIVDTSEPIHKLLAYIEKGKTISSLPVDELPDWFLNGLPAITQAIVK